MGLRGGAENPLQNLISTVTGQKQTSKPGSKKKRSSTGGAKVEKGLRIVQVKGDGRCLFRALVRPLTPLLEFNPSGDCTPCFQRGNPCLH